MSTQNFYALLGDDENEDPTAVIDRATTPAGAADKQQPAVPAARKQQSSAASVKVPINSLPAADTVKESQRPFSSDGAGRGRGGRFPRGGGRGGIADRGNVGSDRTFARNGEADRVHVFDKPIRSEDSDYRSPEVGGRGRGRGRGRDHRERVLSGDSEDRPRRREFDRHSGSGRGHEMKRDGAGRGNWGIDGDHVDIHTDPAEVAKDEKPTVDSEEKKAETEAQPEHAGEELEEKKEDNEMTLDEYEKILEEKKKALSSSKGEERKVKADKAFESMHLVDRKNDNDVFIKLGSDKEKGKKKESLEKEEKIRKAVSINEFLKPADGEKYYGTGRGRGRGRGDRGAFRGGYGGAFGSARRVSAPRIEDPGQFPTLSGAK